ncbi:MAG: type I restriction-modification enzyme R subunit C-terminal domain-containing protein [Nodularia sp. CChRGM 3473]
MLFCDSDERNPTQKIFGKEYVDYALVNRDGKPLAIVEAKRSSRDALAGKRQASDYADRTLDDFKVYSRPNATLIDFLRHILGLVQITSQEEEISTAFEEFIAAHPGFSAKQIYFLRTMRSAILRRARLTVHDLQQPPFS